MACTVVGRGEECLSAYVTPDLSYDKGGSWRESAKKTIPEEMGWK